MRACVCDMIMYTHNHVFLRNGFVSKAPCDLPFRDSLLRMSLRSRASIPWSSPAYTQNSSLGMLPTGLAGFYETEFFLSHRLVGLFKHFPSLELVSPRQVTHLAPVWGSIVFPLTYTPSRRYFQSTPHVSCYYLLFNGNTTFYN